jgi:pSer/pThr/pTyr-binding forkhead associated (FHA) protein
MPVTRSDFFDPNDPAGAAARTRPRPPLRWVGVLTPLAGHATREVRVEQDELVLGRDNDCSAVLADASVSRRHARIRRRGDEFLLEDLGSRNGTHVDGVPILSCLLHDGDAIQLGQNLFYFERILEPAESGQEEAS